MAQGKREIWIAAVMLATTAVAGAPAQQQTSAPAQQTSIPDAPRAQTLPDLRTITPVGAAINAPAPPPESNSDGQTAPGTSLPSSPSSVAQQPSDEDQPPPQAGAGAFRIRVESNFVEIPFIVKDSKGQLVPGISWREVKVFENGTRQQMAVFTTDPFPLSVALVIDQSVVDETMAKINNSLSALQGAFTPYDEVAVFTYNNGVKQQTAFTGAQSARLGQILVQSKGAGREPLAMMGGPLSKGITRNGQDIDPNTNGNPNHPNSFQTIPKEFHTLNDAILAAAAETTHAAKGRRRIVYVISDGKEYGSKVTEKQVIKYCLTNKVSVWATVVGESAVYGMGFLDRVHIPFTMRDNALLRYTATTAGQLDSEFRQKGIENSFAKIASEARNQYTIGYYSHETLLDGKYRKVDVRVARPNLTVIAKEGYFPTAADTHPPTPTPTAMP